MKEHVLWVEILEEEEREFEGVGPSWRLQEPIKEVDRVRGLLCELFQDGILDAFLDFRFFCVALAR